MKKIFLLALLSSCTLNKMTPGHDLDYPTCPSWKTPLNCEESASLPIREKWWQMYGDFFLNDLEEQALQNNLDLQIAFSRLLQARSLSRMVASEKWPHLYLDPSYSRQSALVTLEDFGLGSKDVRIEERQFAFPFDLCYEIDLWGKFQNLGKAACERFFASEFHRSAILNAVTADVASLYFTLRALDEEILYLEKAVDVRKIYRDINLERSKKGLDSEIDLTRSELDLALANSSLVDSKRLRNQTENALALLLGVPACSFCLPTGLLPTTPFCTPPDLPSTLISRRPDIQQKMHLAMAGLHEIGAARSEYFPQFTLTGALGFANPSFSSLFTWHSRLWALAINACQLLFDGGRVTSKVGLRKAEYLQSILEYRKQVILAFSEVENALNEVASLNCQFKSQEQAVLFSQDTAKLARHQYDCGLCNYLLVADEEKTQLNARRVLIHLRGRLFVAHVQLIKALGGGFDVQR